MKITINGRPIEVTGMKTVLEVAREQGIYIPSLCDHPGLAPFAGCRLCLVEIKGKKGFPPSCSTCVEDGLEILTETPQLQTLRRQVMELILSEHPNACLICAEKKNCEDYKSTIRKVGEVTGCVLCPNNSRCQLQEVVEALKIDRVNFPSSYRNFDLRRDDPFFDRNYNLCILCGRCVRMCHEVRGASAVSFVFRGSRAVVGTAFNRPLLESGCQFCGACVDVCPTGALAERASRNEGLPDEKCDTICPLCSIGCELTVELKKGKILSSIPKDGETVNGGQACVKGRFVLRAITHSPKRILKPMVRRNGELQEANWEEALDFVAQKLRVYKRRDVAFISSPQLGLEDNYIFQKFAQQILHTSISEGSFRLSPLAVYFEELQKQGLEPELNFEISALGKAKIILLIDVDIVISHPLIWLEIMKAVRKGATLVVINHEESSLTRSASFHFRVKPGTEFYLFSFLCQQLIENGEPNRFSGINGHDDLKKSLQPLNISAILSSTGNKGEDLRRVARLLSEGQASVFLFGPAMLCEPQAGANIRALWNLSLLSGARVIPLAGENNQRGVFEIWRRLSGKGLSLSEILSEAGEGRVKALYLAGPFPILAKKTADFMVIQDSFLNENVKFADAVFPAATFAESEGTYVNAEGRIQQFKRLIEPVEEARPDWWIICQLAQKMGANNFAFKSTTEIAEELSLAMPVFEEASPRHRKRGKPSFIIEETKEAKKFLPVEIDDRLPETAPENPLVPAADFSLDYYRSLNLSEEVKGLRRLRDRQKLERED